MVRRCSSASSSARSATSLLVELDRFRLLAFGCHLPCDWLATYMLSYTNAASSSSTGTLFSHISP
jgi:hypothetical protein